MCHSVMGACGIAAGVSEAAMGVLDSPRVRVLTSISPPEGLRLWEKGQPSNGALLSGNNPPARWTTTPDSRADARGTVGNGRSAVRLWRDR